MKSLRILWSICLLLFVFTRLAGKLFPSLASSPLSYWSWLTNMILIPVGLVLSVYVLLSQPESRRKVGWLTLGFTGMYAVMLAILLTSSFLTYRLLTLPEVDALPALLGKLYAEESPRNPRAVALAMYTVSGVEVPYRTSDTSYEIYRASDSEKMKWEEYKKDKAAVVHQLTFLAARLQQFFTLITVSLSILLLSILAGTLALILGGAKNAPAEPLPMKL